MLGGGGGLHFYPRLFWGNIEYSIGGQRADGFSPSSAKPTSVYTLLALSINLNVLSGRCMRLFDIEYVTRPFRVKRF